MTLFKSPHRWLKPLYTILIKQNLTRTNHEGPSRIGPNEMVCSLTWNMEKTQATSSWTFSIGRLPLEIIIDIAEFLSHESAICFAMSCTLLHSLIARKYMARKCHRLESSGRLKLLDLLERDLPKHVTCYKCERLHAIKDAKYYLEPESPTSHGGHAW